VDIETSIHLVSSILKYILSDFILFMIYWDGQEISACVHVCLCACACVFVRVCACNKIINCQPSPSFAQRSNNLLICNLHCITDELINSSCDKRWQINDDCSFSHSKELKQSVYRTSRSCIGSKQDS